ncbi:MAG TPA: hypothetical protein VFP34_14480 [Microlunatus sp.]|nr:hypothetical protein [Microlunatus sp.]
MTTDVRAPNHPNPPSTDSPAQAEEKKKLLDLSLTQVVGGAMAAMTSAAIGSTLGVGGTIAGAALASIVAGVAGALYTSSLRTGRDKVRTVFRGGVAGPGDTSLSSTGINAQTRAGGRGAVPIYQPSASLDPALQETVVAPAWQPVPVAPASSPAQRGPGRRSFPWKRAVAISLAVFALAAVLITGYERVSGASLSGGTGTTVSQVGTGGSSSKDQKPTPIASPTPSSSATPSEASATPQPSTGESGSSPSASDSPSPSASAPSSTPEPSTAVGGTTTVGGQ